MASPRISIIITSYKQVEYLSEAIESVLQQTELPHEIIIADDASTDDDSASLIKRYEQRSPLSRSFFQSRNIGIPANRNAALRLATGDYVAVLDGDDRLLPEFVQVHREQLERSGAGCSYSNFYLRTAGEAPWLRANRPEPSGSILGYLAGGRMGVMHSMVVRVDLLRQAGYLDERFPLHDGFILGCRLAALTQFVYTAQPLMEKREHAGGVSKAVRPHERVRYQEDLAQEVNRITQHLPTRERKRIQAVWSRRLLEARVVADVAERNKRIALRRVLCAWLGDITRAGPYLRLVRKILLAG